MTSLSQLHDTLCPTCGQPHDETDGLCLACMMQIATDPAACDALPWPDGESQLPRIGSYELLGEIDRGGMGVIYRARDVRTSRVVAMKILQSQITHQPEILARFQREAQTAASLDHPHVLPIYEVNEERDGVPFYTMKLAEGGSLRNRHASLRRDHREIAALMAKVAHAAHHAHERGVLHRDLKPGNILFDAQGEPMVADFGLAAWLHQPRDLSRTSLIFGTAGYLPPEFVDGRPEVLLPASDVYSLGVILYELLSGRLPFEGKSALTTLREASERPAPLLRRLLPSADRDLEVICARCLEAEPDLRYPSALALADDLERWHDCRPILARPTPHIVRAWKLVRRHPAVSAASALCVLLAVAGFLLETQLASATAYDRTVAVFPIEDLDNLTYESDRARDASRTCGAAAGRAKKVTSVPVVNAYDPMPRGGELARLSQQLGARYILFGTVRTNGKSSRIAIQIIDAALDAAISTTVVEYIPSHSNQAISQIERAIDGIDAAIYKRTSSTLKTPPATPSDESERTAADLIQVGNMHLDRGTLEDVELAIRVYRKALDARPSSVEAISRLAGAMAHRSMFGDRKTWLNNATLTAQRAVATGPLEPGPHRTLAHISSLRGDFSAAKEQALRAYELQPLDSGAASAVSEVMANSGCLDKALDWNQKAIMRRSAPRLQWLYRGDFLAAVGAFEQAEKTYKEFLDVRPDLAEGYEALANLHLLDGHLREALEEMRNLQRKFPTHPAVIENLACIEFHVGESSVAGMLFQNLSADDEAGLHSSLGVRALSALGCLARTTDEVAGRALIERALRLDEERLGENSHDSRLLFEKCANLNMLGRQAEALLALHRAAECAQWTYFQMKLDRRLESLRKNAEFQEIMNALDVRMQKAAKRFRTRGVQTQ